MKKFGQTARTIAAAMAFCFVGMLSISANAENNDAIYQKNTTYVGPTSYSSYAGKTNVEIPVNSKGKYYSILKYRMKSYDDMTIGVVYPKGEALSVSTSKKALSAAITSQELEDPESGIVKKYVSGPNAGTTVEKTGAFYVTKTGESWRMEKDNNGYYIEKFYTGNPWKKIYRNPTYTTRFIKNGYTFDETYLQYNGQTGTRTYTYDLYDDGRGEGWYYKPKYSYGNYKYADGQNNSQKEDATGYEYSKAVIRLDSTKKGNYSVRIKVGNRTTTVKIYVTDNVTEVSQIKLDKSVLEKSSRKASSKSITSAYQDNYYVSSKAKSGKLKVSATKGYKITGMVVAYVNKDGKAIYKKVKNGKKITLSQALPYRDTSTTGYYSKGAKKRTDIYISYKDSYTGYSVTYVPVKKGGLNKIKRTIKYIGDSTKYVDYLTYGQGKSTSIYAY